MLKCILTNLDIKKIIPTLRQIHLLGDDLFVTKSLVSIVYYLIKSSTYEKS